ncbi:MAG: M81 family metallopeptidase [Alphaproteobacteria bacterium]
MRLVVAMMKHETNTFSPVPTPLAAFARGTPTVPEGQAAIDAFKGTGTAFAAFLELAEAAGAEVAAPIAGAASPSAPVDDAAYAYMSDRIADAVAAGCDGVLLDLHGAMVTQSLEDGEGALLARLRGIAPDVPIGVALDMHTNLYPALAENATVLAGYQTYPHIDSYETGMRAGKAAMAAIRGEVRPALAWGQKPMLPHVMRQGTDDFPNRELQEMTRRMEREGALAATLFTGFPHADILNAGLSAVVVTDGDMARAEAWRDELLDFAWANRAAFVYEIEPLAQSLKRAATLREKVSGGPVVLLDHYDNSASGGTMDCTAVLGAVLEARLEDVAAFAIRDAEAAAAMHEAGVGAEVTLDLGGKTAMPAIGAVGRPLKVTGTVKAVTDGLYRNEGPASKGVLMDMGPTAVLDTGRVQIVVISRNQEPNDLNCLRSLGIEPTEKRFLMLKSRIHYRAGFKRIAAETVECAGEGVCTSDYSSLTFRHVRRPIYPLDTI